MSQKQTDPKSQQAGHAGADEQELDEASLETVAGGTANKAAAKKGETYLKVELKDVLITG